MIFEQEITDFASKFARKAHDPTKKSPTTTGRIFVATYPFAKFLVPIMASSFWNVWFSQFPHPTMSYTPSPGTQREATFTKNPDWASRPMCTTPIKGVIEIPIEFGEIDDFVRGFAQKLKFRTVLKCCNREKILRKSNSIFAKWTNVLVSKRMCLGCSTIGGTPPVLKIWTYNSE